MLPFPRRQPDPNQFRGHDLRPLGHRDWATVRAVHRTHRGRHVTVPRPGSEELRVRGMRRVRQAVGYPGLPVQADVPGARE